MGIKPEAAVARYECGDGIAALPAGLLWIESRRAIVAADAHLAYEDVIGGALPVWSTDEARELLGDAARRYGAREIVLLGDIIHGSVMSEGAAQRVGEALDHLRSICAVTLVAGNHEGRSRGVAVLGETVESLERDGWTLVHGDDCAGSSGRRIVGHLHPSLPLAGNQSIPVFLLAPSLIVVPALTPYSRGLSVLSDACARAIEAFDAHARTTVVVASGPDRVYPFGRLSSLRGALRSQPAGALRRPYGYRRRSR